jgi:sodium-dependent dicarboxylate transporter 2/3/5
MLKSEGVESMFDKIKRSVVVIGVIMFLFIILAPSPEGLSPAGKNSFAVFILCLSLWVSQALPLSITGLLGIALIPLLDILTLERAFSLFGNRAIFFILGALILAAGIYQTGLGSRMSFRLLRIFGQGPRRLLVGILLTSAALSCIMPEHAVAALLFPIIVEIATSLELEPLQSTYGKWLFLSMAWGAIAGGITTFLGGARNLLAVGMLERNYGITIGFFEWIKYSWPIPTLILIAATILLAKVLPIDINSISKARKKLKKEKEQEGDMSPKEKKLSVVLGVVVLSWLFLSSWIDVSVISILGAVLTFVIGVVEWEDIEQYINWGVILMYGGAIVVATSLVETEATTWLSETVFSQLNLAPFMFLVFLAIFTMLITEGVSNVAAVAIILPLAFSVAEIHNINPVIITLSVALPGGLAFNLPMGSPPNAIAFSSGFYRVEDAVKMGVVMMFIAWISYILVARFYWPLLGLEIIS